MKKFSKILAIFLVLTFAIGNVLSTSATKYVATPVSEDFETATVFLQPGDLDADGAVNTADYNKLRGELLEGKGSTYYDVNGDGIFNICDLVLQDINSKSDFLSSGKMNLNGKSIYNAEIANVFNTGAEYKVTYTATGDVAVKLIGLDGVEVTESGYTFKTPLSISNSDIQLYVVGEGVIDDFKIQRINMDNDYAVPQSYK